MQTKTWPKGPASPSRGERFFLSRGLGLLLLLAVAGQPATPGIVFASPLHFSTREGNYVIENRYYRAVIPREDRPWKEQARGVVRELYVRRPDGTWSPNLVFNKFHDALGNLEGGISHWGLQHAPKLTTRVERTAGGSIRIISEVGSYNGRDWKETWTFFPDVPYFISEARDLERKRRLSRHEQYAWMINLRKLNDREEVIYYGSDRNGRLREYRNATFQTLFSPLNKSRFPFINFQFKKAGVSLGMIFVSVNNPLHVNAETLGFGYEYQLNFFGSPALVASRRGQERSVTTVYVVQDEASNKRVMDLSANLFLSVTPVKVAEDNFLAAEVSQNVGEFDPSAFESPGFTLYSLYYRAHLNTERGKLTGIEPHELRIHPPIFFEHVDIQHKDWHTFADIVETVMAGFGDDQRTVWADRVRGAKRIASRDGRVGVKFELTDREGTFRNVIALTGRPDTEELTLCWKVSQAPAAGAAPFLEFKVSPFHNLFFLESPEPRTAIAETLGVKDGVWSRVDLDFDEGTTFLYFDCEENVDPLWFKADRLKEGNYSVFVKLLSYKERRLAYHWSLNGTGWTTVFSPLMPAEEEIRPVKVGRVRVDRSDPSFRIAFDDGETGGECEVPNGIDGVILAKQPAVSRISAAAVDIQWVDSLYGRVGQAVGFDTSCVTVHTSPGGIKFQLRTVARGSGRDERRSTGECAFTLWNHLGWLDGGTPVPAEIPARPIYYEHHRFSPWLQEGGTHLLLSGVWDRIHRLEVTNNSDTRVTPELRHAFEDFPVGSVKDVKGGFFYLDIPERCVFRLDRLDPGEKRMVEVARRQSGDLLPRICFHDPRMRIRTAHYHQQEKLAKIELTSDVPGAPIAIFFPHPSFVLAEAGRAAFVLRNGVVAESDSAYGFEYLPAARAVYFRVPDAAPKSFTLRKLTSDR